MKKFIDLFYILVLSLSYVAVYEIASTRASNECKMDVELRDLQISTYLKQKYKR